ncbi:MAG: methanogenesis marker 9 domain-containing protein [Methanolobus sp.]|nr:methanogenesis marker 9 domain-containing protein [Methanolobus sp.]
MSNDLFNIKIGNLSFRNPIALAPMGGMTNSSFANEYAKDAGLVIIGGYNLDAATQEAAKAIVERGRGEFVSDEPLDLIESEIKALNEGPVKCVNVRSTTLEPLIEAARLLKNNDAILELDAHCRQKEMTGIGAGQALLHKLPELCEWIGKIKESGVILSVKVRANIVDDIGLVKSIEAAGADILHLDAMKEGAGADLKLIKEIRDSTRMFLICNNSVTDIEAAKDMFTRGADVVSVARGVVSDPALISNLVRSISLLQNDMGWYNAPKHVCRGEGDLRGLAFCCLPVKPCPVHNNIKKLGYTAQEFADIKMEFARGNMLEYGDSTCFGSLAWCCKISKPCFLRDGVLETLGVTDAEYMRLKKELADHLLNHAKNR